MGARSLVRMLVAVSLLVGGAVAWAASGSTSSNPHAAANRQAARSDATHLLSLLRLPAGAVAVSRDPAAASVRDGANPPCCSIPASYPATPNLVDVHRFWRVPGDPRAVIDWIREHAPAGARIVFQGDGGTRTGGILVWDLGFGFGDVPGRLTARMLVVETAAASGGGTALRADGQSVWLLVRPRSERIPNGVETIAVLVRRLAQPPRLERTVTRRATVNRIIALLDDLKTAQPGARSCPADSGTKVELSLYGARGRRLAQAVADPSGCGAVALTIRGYSQPPLTGGPDLVAHLESLLGMRLT